MTFDEWAEQHDLVPHERILCREYLVYLRVKRWATWIVEFLLKSEADTEVDDA